MHAAVLDFVTEHRPTVAGDVLDIGGRDINGTARQIFADAVTYQSVDLHPGNGVDIVGDICDLGLHHCADTVLCLEVLEHSDRWGEIVHAAVAACRPGGTILITCAGPTRIPHSGIDGGPLRDGEPYATITSAELSGALAIDGVTSMVQELGDDIQAWAEVQR